MVLLTSVEFLLRLYLLTAWELYDVACLAILQFLISNPQKADQDCMCIRGQLISRLKWSAMLDHGKS